MQVKSTEYSNIKEKGCVRPLCLLGKCATKVAVRPLSMLFFYCAGAGMMVL